MQWNETLAANVKTPQATFCGTSCYFVKLTPSVGLKLYATALERDASYVAQSVGAENGIAPETGQCIEIDNLTIPFDDSPVWWSTKNRYNTPKRLYGFLTEVVTRFGHSANCRDFEKLAIKIAEIGFGDMPDISDCNTGFNDDGELIVIDWDARMTGVLQSHEFEIISREYCSAFPYEDWSRIP